MAEQRTVPARRVESLEDVQRALDELVAAHNNLAQFFFWTTGTPEGAVTATHPALCFRRDGGAGTGVYVKESGTNSNTGWIAK